ncbi:MAG: hypothetical protein C6W58_12430 [Bacillaceae bacterium]|nr:MAG: hypothetical protein C6W58_12430 [Bacillaceae bacterium]
MFISIRTVKNHVNNI